MSTTYIAFNYMNAFCIFRHDLPYCRNIFHIHSKPGSHLVR